MYETRIRFTKPNRFSEPGTKTEQLRVGKLDKNSWAVSKCETLVGVRFRLTKNVTESCFESDHRNRYKEGGLMKGKLIVSLDMTDIAQMKSLVEKLASRVVYYKIGSIPFTFFGPEIIAYLKEKEKKVMLDLKYHDIPNTVARACEGALNMGVDLITVHASGGFSMLEEAVKAILMGSRRGDSEKPKLLGITVLTSIDEAYFSDLFGNVQRTLAEQVIFLAQLARSAGLDGVVASPQEIVPIRQCCGEDFLIVTPGIRPAQKDVAQDDQARTMTPAQAIRSGADYIVVGRPIVKADDPVASAEAILKEIENGYRACT
jgi:orotidine-5'-phosphate decarboxylase